MRQWCKTGINIPSVHDGDSCSNQDCRISFDLVDNETKKFNFDQIVKNYHTYKPSVSIVGRSINWLIKDGSFIIGAIGIGSSVMAMKPRDDFIGWKKDQRLKNLIHTATNWRFCLLDKNKGYGSRVLSLLCHEAQKEWLKKFGNKLVLLETLVEPPYNGTCYKANGWNFLGETKGFQLAWKKKEDVLPTDHVIQRYMKFNDETDLNMWKVCTGNNTKKLIFVKPLHRYWRKVLLKNNNEGVGADGVNTATD